MKQTTVRVDAETAQTLFSLKKELGLPTMCETIKHLLNLYRETHGWSVIAIAEEVKKLADENTA